MSLEKYNELRAKFHELDEEWKHTYSEKTPKGILTLFAKLIIEDYDNTSGYAMLATNRAFLVDNLLAYAKRWGVLNEQELYAFSISAARFGTMKCFSTDRRQVSPLNENLFVEYLSERLGKNDILQTSLDIGSDAVSLKYEEKLLEIEKSSNLFNSHENLLSEKLTSIYNQTIQELLNEIDKATKKCETDKIELLKQIENEKTALYNLIEKYDNISKTALNSLSSAFRKFKRTKRKEMDGWKKTAKRFGIAALLVALIGIIGHPAGNLLAKFDQAKSIGEFVSSFFSDTFLYLLVFEALIIYFFRISLNNFYAARDELLQLEIREALCQFAPTYTAFADTDDNRLDSFAKHIFSPLASKLNPTPHPLDFLGQVCNVVNNGKKK